MTLNDNPLWLLSHIRNSFVISDETGNSGLVLDTAGETYASDQDCVAATLGLGGKEQVWSLTHVFLFASEKRYERSCVNTKASVRNIGVSQALFFTGFWTTPTNGFDGFLSLEKKSLSLGENSMSLGEIP